MDNRNNIVVVSIVLSMGLVVQCLIGSISGQQQDWFGMCFFFFLAAFTVYIYVGFLLNLKIDTCFNRMQDLISMKSDATRLANRLIDYIVTIFMVISAAFLASLSILAGLRKHWLVLCVLLVALASTVFICRGVMIALKIDAYSKHLEEIISKGKNDSATKEQPVEKE